MGRHRALCFLVVTVLHTLSSSSPISSHNNDPPKTSEGLAPRYHALLNLLWASWNAIQLVVTYKILNRQFVDHRTTGSHRLIWAAIATRIASHLLTAAFAEFELSSWDLTVTVIGGPGRSSILGTLADASSCFRSLMNPTHETKDRLLLRSLWACILYLSYSSFVHPEPWPPRSSQFSITYVVYLLLLLILSVDCLWWSRIIDERVMRKGKVSTPFTKDAPFLGAFICAAWVLRCMQHPIPFFVIDTIPHILVHPLLYSMAFWSLIASVCKEDNQLRKYSAVIFFGTVACFYITMILFVAFSGKS